MNVKVEEMDGKYIATLKGEMDTAAATEVEELLKRSTRVMARMSLSNAKTWSISHPAACASCSAS